MGKKTQMCAWADEQMIIAVDAKRQELSVELGRIPTRSDLLRAALESYLGLAVTAYDQDTSARSLAQKRRWAREKDD